MCNYPTPMLRSAMIFQNSYKTEMMHANYHW